MQQIPYKDFFYKFYPEMYHSIHAYQSTEGIENHWKDFRFQSQNGIKNTYHQARINTILFTNSLWICLVRKANKIMFQ